MVTNNIRAAFLQQVAGALQSAQVDIDALHPPVAIQLGILGLPDVLLVVEAWKQAGYEAELNWVGYAERFRTRTVKSCYVGVQYGSDVHTGAVAD